VTATAATTAARTSRSRVLDAGEGFLIRSMLYPGPADTPPLPGLQDGLAPQWRQEVRLRTATVTLG
jgi:hypothetical protein